jgi:hypothetical protein
VYFLLLAATDSNQVHADDTSPKFFDMLRSQTTLR